MKKILFRTFILILGIIPSLSISVNYANAQDCMGFGCTPHVGDVQVPWTKTGPSSALLDTIKLTINRILWILATVALVICMYGWFKMLTSWWDNKWYEAGAKVLKNAAIWLAIIWLSWLIVSAVIRFVWSQSWDQTMVTP